MKININLVKETPNKNEFNFCVFGEPNNEIQKWINYHKLSTIPSGKYTNIIIPENFNIDNLFIEKDVYKYMDGFSPNLNKHLHVGHLSNLTIASTFQSMGITENVISIMGDTLDGNVDSDEAFKKYQEICELFNYNLGNIYYASNMEYDGDLLVNGTGDYIGTKIFNVDGDQIVGIKSNGTTSYFYQDVALASQLNDKTLYLTGFEQDNHFTCLNKLFPQVNHLGLGLVMIDGKKMSSSDGNVIMAQDMLDIFNNEFKGNIKVSVNILKGQILKSKPSSIKHIDTKNISNPKTSFGLYLSYTTARLNSAGSKPSKNILKFNSNELHYLYLKSKFNLTPNLLLKGLVELSNKINQLYTTHTIKGNTDNQMMFQPLIDDLVFGMYKLGMYYVDKIE